MLLVAWWAVPGSSQRVIVVLIAAALIFLPVRWLLRLGGIEPRWELRALQDAAGELANRYPTSPRSEEFVRPMRRLIVRMEAIRAPELVEMRDLLVVDYLNTIEGVHHFADLGLRAIREHQIECEIFGPQARRTELDSTEATFRWHLYRAFGDMIDAGAARDPEYVARMEELVKELEQYRRSGTEEFVDALRSSAEQWLASPSAGSWADGGVRSLGPAVEQSYIETWPRKSIFWGAALDDRDADALKAAMEGRGSKSE